MKASIAALDELILACEKSMLSPLTKGTPVKAVNVPTEETPVIDEKLSQDDADLAEFYASIGEGE